MTYLMSCDFMQTPRPLPPNPVAKSQSSPSPVVSHKPPAVGKGGVSSARERRRRNKQEGGGSRGRVVLKSRSAADLCKKEERRREEVDCGTPPVMRREVDEPSFETKNETNSDKKERGQDRSELRIVPDNGRGNDEPDSGPQPLEDNVKTKNNEIHVDVATPLSKDGDNHQQPVVVGKKVSRTRRVKSDSDNVEVVGNGAVAMLNGQSSDEVEVEEFFTLLDTTLHLPDSPLCLTPFDSEDHPGPPMAAFSGADQHSQEEEHHQRVLPPGRLADRIKALRE